MLVGGQVRSTSGKSQQISGAYIWGGGTRSGSGGIQASGSEISSDRDILTTVGRIFC